mgnify:CR=1 FL=1
MGRAWSLIEKQDHTCAKPPCKDGVEQGKGKGAHTHNELPAGRQTYITGQLVIVDWQKECSGKN